jgi:signal transduction histidine kinase
MKIILHIFFVMIFLCKVHAEGDRERYEKLNSSVSSDHVAAIKILTAKKELITKSLIRVEKDNDALEQELRKMDSVKAAAILNMQQAQADSMKLSEELVKAVAEKRIRQTESLASFSSVRKWWQTGIILSFCIGLFSLVLWYLLYRYRAKMRTELIKVRSRLKFSQEKLIEKEFLASKGEVTAGVAHEIRNPLNFINNFSDMSKELMEEYLKTAEESERQELLNSIRDNIVKVNEHALRAASIISSMAEEHHVHSGVTIKELLHESVVLATYNNQSKTFSIVEEYDPQIKTVHGNRSDLQRVFLNLISNAAYALNKKSEHAPAEWKPELKINVSRKSEHIHISISDNGPGIPASISEKLFTPFFTTKPAGTGTGLGLSMSKDIIEKHNGTISMNSFDGNGTSFFIQLPI